MSEIEIKKHTVAVEEPRPLLSLNPNRQNAQNSSKKNVHFDAAEQEALWSRSLEYFEHMNAPRGH